MKKCIVGTVLMICILASSMMVLANESKTDKDIYRLGKLYNTGKGNGYAERNAIEEDDLHSEWELGQFYIKGFSRQILDDNGTPIFLKNAGDEVALWFDLQQDITALGYY